LELDALKYSIPELSIMAPKQSTLMRLTPSSISVMDNEVIEENNVNSLNDITSLAPNFFMPDYGSKLTSPVYIRGIGSRINSPSVGLNVDFVPFFEKAAFDFDMFDIERIEILRGPQGTLYGRNTMGGLINVYTKSPINHEGTEFVFNTGNYDFYNANINHYNKISDDFGYSVNVNYITRGGYFKNEYTNESVDDAESIGGRARIVYKLNEKNTIENITNVEISEEGGYPYAIFNTETQSASNINYNEYSFYNRDMISNAFVYKYSGDRYQLHATSAYQYIDDLQGIDQDLSPESIYYVNQSQAQDMFSQEVIVKSNYKENYNWLCGGYAFYQGFNRNVDVNVYQSDVLVNKGYDHKIYGGAVFHESTMSNFFFDGLSFTFGIRADIERDQLDYTESNLVAGNLYPKADTSYNALNSFQVLPKMAFTYEFNQFSNSYFR
jgi:outer membrane receptor protein involved in Fe transport